MDILQVSTSDRLGGAERVAWDLFRSYRNVGHRSRLAVGRRRSDDPDIIELRHEDGTRGIRHASWRAHRLLQPYYSTRFGRRLCRLTHQWASPEGWADRGAGREDFHFPGTEALLSSEFASADILHAHNLHGSYFDLRILPRLSRARPLVLTLHDAWLLAGHCAHSKGCDRWRTGCGACPDLSIYPAIKKDATAENWRTKSEIFKNCRLFVATPCAWLMRKVEQSMLMPAIVERRVIPYGVDLSIFKPGDRATARNRLGIRQDADVLLFAANGIRKNAFKDFETLRRTLSRLAARGGGGRPLQFMALGESGSIERIGDAVVEFRPFLEDPTSVAAYYQAADVYVHAAKADTFPCTILEALACGTPVAATCVGGIGEQVRPAALTGDTRSITAWNDDPTGTLSPAGDDEALAAALGMLLENATLRHRCGATGVTEARNRFDLRRHASDYLNWYREILNLATEKEIQPGGLEQVSGPERPDEDSPPLAADVARMAVSSLKRETMLARFPGELGCGAERPGG